MQHMLDILLHVNTKWASVIGSESPLLPSVVTHDPAMTN